MELSIISEKLEDIRNYLDVELHPVVSPDRWDVYSELCNMVDDIIALLKAQEPVEPYGQYSVHTGTKYIVCGACEKPLCMMKDSYRPKYCPECGRMVKWHANEAEK